VVRYNDTGVPSDGTTMIHYDFWWIGATTETKVHCTHTHTHAHTHTHRCLMT
jgi:hypothetical protein